MFKDEMNTDTQKDTEFKIYTQKVTRVKLWMHML